MEELSATRTRLTDTVSYEAGPGAIGRIADALFVRRQIDAMFAYRHQVTRELLETAEATKGPQEGD